MPEREQGNEPHEEPRHGSSGERRRGGRRGHSRRRDFGVFGAPFGPAGFGPGFPPGFPGPYGPGGAVPFELPLPKRRYGRFAGGHGRPRGRRGDVRAAALALLAEEPRNGYQLIQEIGLRSGGVWKPSPGSIYPALQQLEDEGLIQAEIHGERKVFVLTEAGQRYVEANAEEIDAPWDAVAEPFAHLHGVRTTAASAFIALQQVLAAGSADQIERAERVLDETRRALYRILADDPEPGRDDEADAPQDR